MKKKPDFYLASSDGYGLEEPRKCFRLKRLGNASRDDLLLIRIVPPLQGNNYGLSSTLIKNVIVAPRHNGSSLFPINQWPVFVYVIAFTSSDGLATITSVSMDNTKIIAWAELYKTWEDALHKGM